MDGTYRDVVYVNPDRVAYVKEGKYPTIYLDAGYCIQVADTIYEVVRKLKG